MTLPYLKRIRDCRRCFHFIQSSQDCNIWWCEGWPEVSQIWEEFGLDHAADYCPGFEEAFQVQYPTTRAYETLKYSQ
ncbi:hypothetical protein [Laspinema olomoucense]|uniref:Uncharacterized protein n=1 Tax=Laspinema olomoucense D3b TaxID=2953688 RepID=A0ABT2N4G9_9CYAN|nr:hypothetical protein [Laspinema sp. D3b]MCT7977572.1 hypothetical protein [Laspinema sp. D3b]